MLVFLTGHEGMLLYFGSFGTDVSSSILTKRNNPSQLIIIILYASVLVFLTGVVYIHTVHDEPIVPFRR